MRSSSWRGVSLLDVAWLGATWDTLRASLWVLPGAMLGIGLILAPAMLALDTALPTTAGGPRHWLSGGNGKDATNLLATLLTSVIAMASMVFSVTVVALSLAASAYGPRLIRTFRANIGTQLTLGIFIMTIVYLLLVLRSVREEMSVAELPHASVTLGSFLALVCVLALLAFIQGVGQLMVADEVVRRVRGELDAAIARLPMLTQAPETPASLPDDFDRCAASLPLPREGYVQAVEFDKLIDWASKHDVIVRLDFRPGDFVVEGDRKVSVYPRPADEDATRKQIERFIVSGHDRTPTQDLEFAIRHLVEVAVRALSPGINDPFTAMAVIDRLRGGLCRLAKRRMHRAAALDLQGQLRVVRRETTYDGAVDAAFNQIRQAGSQMPSVLIHMLKTISEIAHHVETGEQRSALMHHAELVRAAGVREVAEPADLDQICSAFDQAMLALNEIPERAS